MHFMKRTLLFFAITLLLLQSCSMPESDIKQIKFSPEIQSVIDRYKQELKPDDFQTSPGWIRFDTIIRHKVIVTLLNARNLPKTDKEQKELALRISADVYDQLINKEDFSEIEVIFQNMSGVLLKMKIRRNYLFTFGEIRQFRQGDGLSLDGKE